MPAELFALRTAEPPLLAGEPPPCVTRTPISPGPWSEMTDVVSGAIPIEDRDGRIIGWATDAEGHTSEAVLPQGRTPAQIAANARAMAAASEALALLGKLAELEPIVTARLMINSGKADRFLADAADRARAILQRVQGGEPDSGRQ